MQKDTRRVTVSGEHLQAAYDEITLAMGQAEQSIAVAAVQRAIDHLNLVIRRLEEERARSDRGLAGTEVERAYTAARAAWQGAHDAVNHWPERHSPALDPVRNELIDALDSISRLDVSAAA